MFIFTISYDGKPEKMAKWHNKVEIRVTQTFRQLNIRRLIDIIGYDPSQYFKGEMSYMVTQDLKKKPRDPSHLRRISSLYKPPRDTSNTNYQWTPQKTQHPLNLTSMAVSSEKRDKAESIYRYQNLSQNFNQIVK